MEDCYHLGISKWAVRQTCCSIPQSPESSLTQTHAIVQNPRIQAARDAVGFFATASTVIRTNEGVYSEAVAFFNLPSFVPLFVFV